MTTTTATATPTETKTINFKVRENYVTDEDTSLHCREVEITGTEGETPMGQTTYDLIRKDTGEKIYPFQLRGMELLGEREYIAISGYGQGWGKGDTLVDALKNMLKASGITKAKAKKLEVLRGIAVYECVKGTGWVSGMGGGAGLMIDSVPGCQWMTHLWNIVKPKDAKNAR